MSNNLIAPLVPSGGVFYSPEQRSGYWYTAPQEQSHTTLALTDAVLWAIPHPVLFGPFSPSSIGLYVTTAVADSSLHLGLYAANDRQGNESKFGAVPGRLLYDFGTVDASTTGQKSIVVSNVILSVGMYFIGLLVKGSPTVRASSYGTRLNYFGVNDLQNNPISQFYRTGVSWGSLPDPFGSITDSVTGTPPRIGFKI